MNNEVDNVTSTTKESKTPAKRYYRYTATQQSLRNGIFNLILPLEEDCNLAPEENLEPNSAGLKSSRTRGVSHEFLEESHSAHIKEKSLLGHLVC